MGHVSMMAFTTTAEHKVSGRRASGIVGYDAAERQSNARISGSAAISRRVWRLQTNKHTDHNDQEIQKNGGPFLIADMLYHAARDYGVISTVGAPSMFSKNAAQVGDPLRPSMTGIAASTNAKPIHVAG